MILEISVMALTLKNRFKKNFKKKFLGLYHGILYTNIERHGLYSRFHFKIALKKKWLKYSLFISVMRQGILFCVFNVSCLSFFWAK